MREKTPEQCIEVAAQAFGSQPEGPASPGLHQPGVDPQQAAQPGHPGLHQLGVAGTQHTAQPLTQGLHQLVAYTLTSTRDGLQARASASFIDSFPSALPISATTAMGNRQGPPCF